MFAPGHRATVFFDADGLSQVINFAETGIRVLGTTGELGVGARVALGGKAKSRLGRGREGESTRAGKLTVLGRKILVLTAGGRVATILERKQTATERRGRRSARAAPMFAPGQRYRARGRPRPPRWKPRTAKQPWPRRRRRKYST